MCLLFSSYLSRSFHCSSWVVSVVLSSGSRILCSVSSVLLLIPSTEVYISALLFFSWKFPLGSSLYLLFSAPHCHWLGVGIQAPHWVSTDNELGVVASLPAGGGGGPAPTWPILTPPCQGSHRSFSLGREGGLCSPLSICWRGWRWLNCATGWSGAVIAHKFSILLGSLFPGPLAGESRLLFGALFVCVRWHH